MDSKSLYFQLQLTDRCNLKCINCMHYAALCEKPNFYSIDEYEKELKCLTNLFGGKMDHIALMGGEPLLHPKIAKFIEISRKYFPIGNIFIVTNALLLSDMNDEFWNACYQFDVEIRPTRYPIHIDFKYLEKLSRKHNVKFKLFNDTDSEGRIGMNKFLVDLRGIGNQTENFNACWKSNACLELNHGRLYTCDIPMHIHLLREYFDLDINEVGSVNGVDIYSVKSANELWDKLAEPIPFCKYCDPKHAITYADPWRISNKSPYEWLKFVWDDRDIEYIKNKNIYLWLYADEIEKSKKQIDKLRNLKVNISGILTEYETKELTEISNMIKSPVLEISMMDKLGDFPAPSIVLVLMNKDKYDVLHDLRNWQKLNSKGLIDLVPVTE